MSSDLQVAGGTRSLAEGNEGRRPPARRLEVVALRFSNHPRNGQKISKEEDSSTEARKQQRQMSWKRFWSLKVSERWSASGGGQDPEHPSGPGTAIAQCCWRFWHLPPGHNIPPPSPSSRPLHKPSKQPWPAARPLVLLPSVPPLRAVSPTTQTSPRFHASCARRSSRQKTSRATSKSSPPSSSSLGGSRRCGHGASS